MLGENLFWSIKNSGEILKLTELIEQTFNREGSLYLACNDNNAFFTSETT